MRYLFQFTVGPVQDFILSARRSRDLWFGSFVLSALARTAAAAIRDQGGTLIFPDPSLLDAPSAQHEPVGVANIIVADLATDLPLAVVGDRIEQTVRAELRRLRDRIFAAIDGPFDRTLADAQVDALLTCAWAGVPFDGVTYPATYELLNRIMAARKQTRDAPQIQLSAAQGQRLKSLIDGQRESVIPSARYPTRTDGDDDRRRKVTALFTEFGAGQAERLSGVDLLKRHGRRVPADVPAPKEALADFPSTSHFAALPFFAQLDTRYLGEAQRRWDEYVATLDGLGVPVQRVAGQRVVLPVIGDHDASLLFEERLVDLFHARDVRLESARQALRHVLAAFSDGRRPGVYYALLRADGDGMGRVLAQQADRQQHQQLSARLAAFASATRAMVEGEHQGALVYAGGDDVLAFLPLHTVLTCARRLHDAFAAQVGDGTFVDATGRPPTLSIGIAVCHHLEPLSDALRLTRRAEQRAKAQSGKDGLAIHIAKRSGEPRLIVGRWADGFAEWLAELISLMGDNDLAAGAPYELLTLAERLNEPRTLVPAHAVVHRAIAEEAARVLERKRGNRGAQPLAEAQLNSLRVLLGLPRKVQGRRVTADPGQVTATQQVTVRQLADELIVARELARAQGQPDRPGGQP